jgi:hypothetical protein
MPSTTLVPGQPASQRSMAPSFAALRLVKVPDGAPPYDCETDHAGLPAAAGPRDAGPGHHAQRPDDFTSLNASPDAAGGGAWPRQLALAMVEILAGLRPMRQALPVTTERTRARIRRLAAILASDRQPRIRRVVAFRPTASAVEVAVVASFGARTRALAMRFEHVAARPAAPGLPHRPARWLCTEIEGA